MVFMSLPGPLIEKMNRAVSGDGRAGENSVNLLSNSVRKRPIIIIPMQDDFSGSEFAAEVSFASNVSFARIAQPSHIRLSLTDAS